MNKHILVFFYLLIIHQSSYAMHGFGAKSARVVSTALKTISYALAAGIFPYQIAKTKATIPSKYPFTEVDQETRKFVLNTLHEAYPELKSRHIKVIICKKRSFFVEWRDNIPHLFVGQEFTEKGLRDALRFQKNKLQRFSNQEFAEQSKKSNLTTQEFIASGELRGYVMTPESLNAWKAILKHEGAHILHEDHIETVAALSILPVAFLSLYHKVYRATGKQITNPRLTTVLFEGVHRLLAFPYILVGAYLLIMPLRYWQEYEADQEVIKRCKNPAELHAISRMFAHLKPTNATTLSAKMKKLCATHPSHAKRAQYFKEAALKLEAKQTALKN